MIANAGAAAAVAVAAAHANAIKACGTLVKVSPKDFLRVLALDNDALVVHATGGVFTTVHRYLTSVRGLAFHCRSAEPIDIPTDRILVEAKAISMQDC
jgi:hypothetical protein